MTNEEILKKAVAKAEENGFVLDTWLKDKTEHELFKNWFYQIIFSQSFAIAFWGKKVKTGYLPFEDKGRYAYEWEFHLSLMVVEEEPLQYLAKFL